MPAATHVAAGMHLVVHIQPFAHSG